MPPSHCVVKYNKRGCGGSCKRGQGDPYLPGRSLDRIRPSVNVSDLPFAQTDLLSLDVALYNGGDAAEEIDDARYLKPVNHVGAFLS